MNARCTILNFRAVKSVTKSTQTAFSPSHPPEGEKNDHQWQEAAAIMQHLEPASRSGGDATSRPRGFRCSTQSEKLL